ncbi:MAG TPA: transglycosylase SLT domain-containing protein [Gemmatimonadales bacterium]|nr:transglycosylase SLT domain-containing protein [Gemmatimonadales bacterium]
MRHPGILIILLTASPACVAAQAVTLDSVENALRAGAYWHATQLLRPRMASATPEATIAAARAAAGWRGWGTVDRLLTGTDWLDQRFDRIGHRLLAESAMARGNLADAVRHARASLPGSLIQRQDGESARRWVLLARAHERLSNWDSAATAYTRAAALAPEIDQWLALRAAGTTRDSATRVRLYRTVSTPVARARVGWTEAMALARFGNREGAAREYAALGAQATALRLRWEANRDPAVRSRLASRLLDLIRSGSPAADARLAVEIVDGYSVAMARSESLHVARRAAALSMSGLANRWFTALERSGTLAPSDRMAWADALASLSKWTEAAATYRRITEGTLAGRAAYLAARADLRGGRAGAAITRLNDIPSRFPNDTFATGNALYLLGDLALDAGRGDSARKLFHRLATRFPTGEFAERAALVAPLIAYARGDFRTARTELEEAMASGVVTGFAADAARYWLARSADAIGDSEVSAAHYRELISRGPENYYAQLSARRLGAAPWPKPTAPRLDGAELPEPLRRAELLSELGLDTEARFELDGFVAAAGSAGEMIAAGEALLAAGHPSLASRMGQRAISAGAPRDGASWRLLYPLPFAAPLLSSARSNNLDPWLVAALIRQESAFEPRATSGAGARGLMQMMPANGPALARTIGLSDYDSALLWQPDVNLAMGTHHFAAALKRYPDLERALAAYNAGGSRVTRWTATPLSGRAADTAGFDPELFVERMPYLETRGYVRNITVNRAMYELLYGQ